MSSPEAICLFPNFQHFGTYSCPMQVFLKAPPKQKHVFFQLAPVALSMAWSLTAEFSRKPQFEVGKLEQRFTLNMDGWKLMRIVNPIPHSLLAPAFCCILFPYTYICIYLYIVISALVSPIPALHSGAWSSTLEIHLPAPRCPSPHPVGSGLWVSGVMMFFFVWCFQSHWIDRCA